MPGQTLKLPNDPPYTYDDPRLTYDEHCFLYDGGYSILCLFGNTRHYGKSTGKKPEPGMLELFFETVYKDQNIKDIKRYKFKKKIDTKISIDDLTIKTSKGIKPVFSGSVVQVKKTLPIVKGNLLDKKKN